MKWGRTCTTHVLQPTGDCAEVVAMMTSCDRSSYPGETLLEKRTIIEPAHRP